MKNEIKIFFTALMFYTRIPCPSWVDFSEERLNQATRYFPLMGWIVGGGMIAVLYGLQFIFPPTLVVILALCTSILLTGAFHEDGFIDVCDGFGGGWTSDRILTIMKDSRVGAYGSIGMFLLLSLTFFSILELLQVDLYYCIKSILLAQVLSRFIPVTLMHSHEYAREDASSKVKPIAKKLAQKDFIISALWLIPAFLLFQDPLILLIFIPAFSLKIYLAAYFQKWIKGYTGDCLGALQQLTYVITLLFCLGICSYI